MKMQILIKENLPLKVIEKIEIEKDLKNFHLKGLEKNQIKQPLNNLTNFLILTF